VASKEEKMAMEKGLTLEDMIRINRPYEMTYEGNITEGAVPLGQSIGAIHSIDSVPDIIDSIIKDAKKYIKKASTYVK
jgi:hypothetical protein